MAPDSRTEDILRSRVETVETMDVRKYGLTRRELRAGGGTKEGLAGEHFDEMIGSQEFHIYRSPNRKLKGYEALKSFLESQGCDVIRIADAPSPVGKGYETIRITNKGERIPVPYLRRAHNWAHQRNLLHLFQKKPTL